MVDSVEFTLHMPEPLSTTRAATSSSHMLAVLVLVERVKRWTWCQTMTGWLEVTAPSYSGDNRRGERVASDSREPY